MCVCVRACVRACVIWISRNDSQLFALPYVMIYENRLVARM